jgi:hypothetical protein
VVALAKHLVQPGGLGRIAAPSLCTAAAPRVGTPYTPDLPCTRRRLVPTLSIVLNLLAERTTAGVNNPLLCHFLAGAVITRTVQQARILAA